MRRLLAALLTTAVLAAGCGPSLAVTVPTDAPAASSPAPTGAAAGRDPSIEDPDGVQAVLDEIAAGFLGADPERVAEHLHDPDGRFGQRWQERATRMGALPLRSYALRLDDALPDIASQRVRDRHAGRVQVLYVVEEWALDGFDERPAADDLFLTMVDAGDGWRVAGDDDADALGLVSVDHLWDQDEVVVTRDGPVLAIHHPDGPSVDALLSEARRALAQAQERWPLDWPGTVPIIVPRDEDELAELLHVTFDLSNFVAFATATPVGERGAYELTGSRIVVNPARFLDRSTELRQRILVHELVHVASRPSSGPLVPSWLEEGVAQALGEQQSTTGTGLLNAVRGDDLALPTDGQFVVGGRDRIFLSYQLAWGFLDHLVRRHGAAAVGAFYLAAGRGSVAQPGTEAHHVDRAAREVFGQSLGELLAQWRASR